ncbi:alpha/beta hydrolase [Nocardioides caldifontis]|uniref:alpha/beta hydrolase n=1 Tax=Nocardioides caldifontis TaxID=2588938 RepID=UPI0011DFCB93|nr:alpha/beta hydrolase [Nocardioides caldifontis]
MIEHRIGASRHSAVVHTVAKVVARPVLRYYPLCGPAARLMPLVDRTAALLPRLSATVHRPVQGRTWRGELVTPIDGPTSDGAIVYFHGGAFLLCGMGTHRRIVERLAERTGMTVLAVDYRQLPKGRLDDSVSDCEDAYRWLLRQGHPPHKVVLAGDSAGGHLAFATALRIRDDGQPQPAGVVGLSPWLDFDHMAKVRHHNSRRDAYIPARRLRRVGRMVVGDHPELHHSPVNADLAGMPPSLIICAEGEVLRVDAELMADRLAEAGVPCTLQIWEGQVHAFPVLTELTPESRLALEEIVTFVEAATSGAIGTSTDSTRSASGAASTGTAVA